MHNSISSILNSNNIRYLYINRSIFNSIVIDLGDSDNIERTISILKEKFPNHIIRNIKSSLQIIVQPSYAKKQIEIPFKLWLKFKTFVDINTKQPSSYKLLSPEQQQSILNTYSSSPYISETSITKKSQISIIQKHISSISNSKLSLYKNCIHFYKHLLRESFENAHIPYQMLKSDPKRLLNSFIYQTGKNKSIFFDM